MAFRRASRFAFAVLSALILATTLLCSTAAASRRHVHRAAARPACGTTQPPSSWLHVVWIVMENEGYGSVIGSSQAPYVNALARQCGLATNYHAIGHPSLPNYIAMTSGGTQGIWDDGPPSSNATSAPSIFSQLPGRWLSYAESMPGACSRWDSGVYAVRHVPATYYTSLGSSCPEGVRPLPGNPSLASFTFVTPNLCNDMHDCSVGTGDRWLSRFVPKLLAKRSYRNGRTAIFITWDEDDGGDGNQVALLAVGRSVPHGARAGGWLDHYSLLRTTEDMLGLPPLGAAAGAPSMRSAFGL